MRLVWGFFALLVICGAAKLAAPEAHAAEAPVTVSFTEVGAHPFTVPAGVSSIHVVAVGAPGGDGRTGLKGGRGAAATADLAVVPGAVLGIYVGGPGASATGSGTAPGGFNGGGNGAGSAGGGGGASDVRLGSATELSSRLVVAGGGGGGGAGGLGGVGSAGGDAGRPGGSVPSYCTGGGAGTTSQGGAGGTGTYALGEPGTEGQGGNAQSAGGGGLFGGGGGGYTLEFRSSRFDLCGGGGGSSGFGPGATNTSVAVSQAAPSVTITYVPSSVSGPGTAPTNPTNPTNPGVGSGPEAGSSKVTLSLPAVQHGARVVGTVDVAADRSALKAKLLWQKPGGGNGHRALAALQSVVGSLTEAPLKPGLHSFTVKLSRGGKKSLSTLGKLKLKLEVTITPPQGAIAVGTKALTLKP